MNKDDLKLKAPKYNDEIEIITTGDENDADHVQETSILSLNEFEEIRPILKKIEKARKVRKPWHNWEDKEEYLTEDEIELLDQHLQIPSGNSDNSIHSIVSFDVFFLSKEDNVRYEVKL